MVRYLLVLLMLVAAPAWPQTSAGRCDVAADMALVARALVEEGVDESVIVGALGRIYTAPRALIVAMTREARIHDLPASVFAGAMREACLRSFKQKQDEKKGARHERNT